MENEGHNTVKPEEVVAELPRDVLWTALVNDPTTAVCVLSVDAAAFQP